MPFLSPAKLLIILVVAVIVLGPDKLPKLAHQVGSLWRDLRRLREKLESEVRGNFPDLPSTDTITRAVRSPLSFLDRLADSPELNNPVPVAPDTAGNPDLNDPSDPKHHVGTEEALALTAAEAGVAHPGGLAHRLRSEEWALQRDPGMN
jgi:Sec-independent protein translocase protein TatA